jgi:hypothetical protein
MYYDQIATTEGAVTIVIDWERAYIYIMGRKPVFVPQRLRKAAAGA